MSSTASLPERGPQAPAVLVLGINYAPELVGIGPYTRGMAEALAEAGAKVTVVAAKPYYPAWKADPAHAGGLWRRSREGGVSITRCAIYVPERPSGLRRILHHLSFAASALLPMLGCLLRDRPACVIAVAPSLIAAPVAWLAARLGGARLWLHIQDFEAEAAVATGLLPEGSAAARLALRLEAALLRSADTVSSISPQMCRRAVAKGAGADRVVEFRNWAEIDRIVPLERPSSYREDWGLAGRKVALYSGNIANKQGIEIIVEVARMLVAREDIAFVICGDGPNRVRLEELAEGLGNVQFRPLQPADRLGELLGLADVCLLPQVPGAADLVLPSKLANMLAAGKPVVATADPGTGLAAEVEGIGLVTPPGDAAAMAAALERLVDDDALRADLGRAARERAIERWSRPALLARFVAGFTDRCPARGA